MNREARRVCQVLVEESCEEQGEALPQDSRDASEIERGKKGEDTPRGQPVRHDEHDAGDRERDECRGEQVLGEPVEPRPQERGGEDAEETCLARDVEAARALELRVVHVLEGIEDAQERHCGDHRERGVGVLR